MTQLTHSVVLVTGANRGISRPITGQYPELAIH